MSLKELNEARKTAKGLGIENAHRMKLAALKDAIDAATDDERQFAPKSDIDAAIESDVAAFNRNAANPVHESEVAAIIAAAEDDRHFAETIAAEEDEQDTPEAAAAYERAMTPTTPDVIGTCEGCGEAVAALDPGVETDEAGMWCGDCATRPIAGPNGVAVNPLKGDGTDDEELTVTRSPLDVVAEPSGDGTDPADEPRADCADEECAAAARERDALAASPVETRETARTRLIAEDPHENRAVLDVRQGVGEFRHLAVPGLHVTLCMKARPTATARTGSLNSVDCIECLDRLVETLARA